MSDIATNSNNPVQVFRDDKDASIAASIWLRSTKVGYFYDVTLARAYPKSEQEVGYSHAFGDRNLNALLRVIAKAKIWIDEQKQNAVTCTGPFENEEESLDDVAA
jgi:hypothetical protein